LKTGDDGHQEAGGGGVMQSAWAGLRSTDHWRRLFWVATAFALFAAYGWREHGEGGRHQKPRIAALANAAEPPASSVVTKDGGPVPQAAGHCKQAKGQEQR
jgi:hypothetical protein